MGKSIPLKSGDLERIFSENIAEYGYKSNKEIEVSQKDEKGTEETYRTDIRRQRDKILYTGGFRRLQDKTQVISASISGDHRTRLTHTLEVEQIAISIANALSLNVDLVSAIALGHDVGHTPFGHAAERKLSELLAEKGRFHHPIQSVRYIWEKYGSKIEKKIYEGILLHDSDMFDINKDDAKEQLKYLKDAEGFKQWVQIDEWINKFPSTLEAQVVIWSDKIAYITHDLEDFIRSSSYVNLQKNQDEIEGKLCCILNDLIGGKDIKTLKKFESRDLIRNIISNLINSSAENIKGIENFTYAKVKEETEKRGKKFEDPEKRKKYLSSLIINFSDEYRENYYKLREFLDNYYILSPEVQKSDVKAEVIVEWLFNKLSSNYRLMPLKLRDDIDEMIISELDGKEEFKVIYNKLDNEHRNIKCFEKEIKNDESSENIYNRIKREIISRKVAVYIATMSDTYAESMYRNLIGSRVDLVL